jgi:hypothetical protein
MEDRLWDILLGVDFQLLKRDGYERQVRGEDTVILAVTAHPWHWQVHWAASTELPARQARMAAKALKPRSIPVSMTEQIAA